MIFREVPLSEIDTEFFPFSFKTVDGLAALADSIAGIGFLNRPVLFLPEGSNLYRVSRGARRVKAALQLGLDRIPVRITKEKNSLNLLLEAIHENCSEKNLLPSEQARALKLLMVQGLSRETITGSFMSLIGQPATPKSFEYLQALVSLPHQVQKAADENLISRDLIIYLHSLPDKDGKIFFETAMSYRLTLSQQRKFVLLLRGLMGSSGFSSKKIMSKATAGFIDNGVKPSSEKQGARLLKALSAMKNPRLSFLEESFRRTTSRMGLPPSASFAHHPTFERKEVTLRIRWKKADEARDVLGKLMDASRKGLIDKLFQC